MTECVLPAVMCSWGSRIVVRTLARGRRPASSAAASASCLRSRGGAADLGRAPEALAVVADRNRPPHHRSVAKRSLGSPALFAIVYTSVAAAIYFSLGVVADHALGMTPFVFLVAGLMFVLRR